MIKTFIIAVDTLFKKSKRRNLTTCFLSTGNRILDEFFSTFCVFRGPVNELRVNMAKWHCKSAYSDPKQNFKLCPHPVQSLQWLAAREILRQFELEFIVISQIDGRHDMMSIKMTLKGDFEFFTFASTFMGCVRANDFCYYYGDNPYPEHRHCDFDLYDFRVPNNFCYFQPLAGEVRKYLRNEKISFFVKSISEIVWFPSNHCYAIDFYDHLSLSRTAYVNLIWDPDYLKGCYMNVSYDVTDPNYWVWVEITRDAAMDCRIDKLISTKKVVRVTTRGNVDRGSLLAKFEDGVLIRIHTPFGTDTYF